LPSFYPPIFCPVFGAKIISKSLKFFLNLITPLHLVKAKRSSEGDFFNIRCQSPSPQAENVKNLRIPLSWFPGE
jgi:hypothetical protein